MGEHEISVGSRVIDRSFRDYGEAEVLEIDRHQALIDNGVDSRWASLANLAPALEGEKKNG